MAGASGRRWGAGQPALHLVRARPVPALLQYRAGTHTLLRCRCLHCCDVGAINFEDGVRLVKLRGESMQAAADAQPSGMVSVIGLSADKVCRRWACPLGWGWGWGMLSSCWGSTGVAATSFALVAMQPC